MDPKRKRTIAVTLLVALLIAACVVAGPALVELIRSIHPIPQH